jgi:hypothetical protein
MKELIITYIVIVILQLIYTIYVPVSSNNETNKIIVNDKEKAKKIDKFIKNKLKILMDKANNMKYSDWLNYLEKNASYEYDGIKMYIFVWENIDKNKMSVVIHPDDNLNGLSWDDFYKDSNEVLLNTTNAISDDVTLNMYKISREGAFDFLEYYWVDPIYKISVKKNSIFTKFSFQNKNAINPINGVIGMGYNLENLTDEHMYKRFTYVSKVEFIMGSLITIILSLIISKLNTVKNTKIKAFSFLIFINLYIFFFMNSESQVSKIVDENLKIETVNKNILNLSFLSSINLFILNILYYSNKDLFIETSVFFGMTIFLLLLATYKSTSQNSIYDLISVTITNTYIFNYAVILNILILANFIFYTFSKSFKKGFIYI